MTSFFELEIGALFTFEDGLKKKAAYQKVGKCQFSRPGGKHKWIAFLPSTLNGPLMVDQFGAPRAMEAADDAEVAMGARRRSASVDIGPFGTLFNDHQYSSDKHAFWKKHLSTPPPAASHDQDL